MLWKTWKLIISNIIDTILEYIYNILSLLRIAKVITIFRTVKSLPPYSLALKCTNELFFDWTCVDH